MHPIVSLCKEVLLEDAKAAKIASDGNCESASTESIGDGVIPNFVTRKTKSVGDYDNRIQAVFVDRKSAYKLWAPMLNSSLLSSENATGTDHDISLVFELCPATRAKLRAQLSPFRSSGILEYHGDNTIGIRIWAQDEAGGAVEVTWEALGAHRSVFDLSFDGDYLRNGWFDRSEYA
ncbi:hypothetical protein F5X68DRAFT_228548 [Plectosphaerella plurivora]|uniref:Uncharacterized protein n=1 Tax=Plectosphaerella plurivora TaxID=936078 RepID=A0A9P9AGZ7_9PEZI|nr:hypothetical protein F5X68DRAFT_228548 [Plectosphaerella plurivora]